MQQSAGWQTMRGFLARIAVGPEGSRDLCREEARQAMALCLTREASDIQIGVFLIAERLKRETFDENLGILEALRAASWSREGPAAELVCLADPFDGFSRRVHYAAPVAAVLAACGLPAYVLGAAEMPPKHGLTTRQVLEALGCRLDLGRGGESVDAAAERLAAGVPAYLDVTDFCPALAALSTIRREIAKRPCLATLEKLVLPLRGSHRTHLVSGWVHAGYERLMLGLLRRSGVTSALLLRGREGHVDPHLHRTTPTLGFRDDGPDRTEEIGPVGHGLDLEEVGEEPLTAGGVAQAWREALRGPERQGAPGRAVRLLAGVVLHQTGQVDSVAQGIERADRAIAHGRPAALLEGMK